MEEQWNSSSSSSSVDNNSCNPSISSQSSFTQSTKRRGFTTTDLRLGLSLSPSSSHHTSPYSRDNESDWAPIKPDIRSLFVKVYMEGIPIGRKLDLLLHDSYQSLIKALRIMFKTTIISPDATQELSAKAAYVLTYEDKEGDWMMVGDVSWDFFVACRFFLTTVRKLKITRVDNC